MVSPSGSWYKLQSIQYPKSKIFYTSLDRIPALWSKPVWHLQNWLRNRYHFVVSNSLYHVVAVELLRVEKSFAVCRVNKIWFLSKFSIVNSFLLQISIFVVNYVFLFKRSFFGQTFKLWVQVSISAHNLDFSSQFVFLYQNYYQVTNFTTSKYAVYGKVF